MSDVLVGDERVDEQHEYQQQANARQLEREELDHHKTHVGLDRAHDELGDAHGQQQHRHRQRRDHQHREQLTREQRSVRSVARVDQRGDLRVTLAPHGLAQQ